MCAERVEIEATTGYWYERGRSPCRIVASPEGIAIPDGFDGMGNERFIDAESLHKYVHIRAGAIFPRIEIFADGDVSIFGNWQEKEFPSAVWLTKDLIPVLLRGLGPELATACLLLRRTRQLMWLGLPYLFWWLLAWDTHEYTLSQAVPVDPLRLLFVIVPFAIWLLARFKPMAWLFLVEGVWLVVLIAEGLYAIRYGIMYPGMLVIYVLPGAMVYYGIRSYQQLVASQGRLGRG